MSGDESDENDKNVGFLYKAMRNRDPRKRRVKPVSRHLMQVNFGDDDSDDDSDYQVNPTEMSDDEEMMNDGNILMDDPDEEEDGEKAEDNNENGLVNDSDVENNTDQSSDDGGSDDDDDDDDDDEDDDSEEEEPKRRHFFDAIDSDDDDDEDYVPKKRQKQVEKHIEKQRIRSPEVAKVPVPVQDTNKSTHPMKVLICCVCLGDISETDDEIVECDNCGVAVHEGCYGISDNQSAASTESSASTEPWFCDACKAGVRPDCELCPNEGGIFKETDAGKWVHLVCALYTPGVAFGDVDKLSPVTLFEMPYSKWGLKECSLCEDMRFSRTGVCISCDAGMCRSYFHVTCAQRNGLLSEASPDEDIADPFYAYCKLHADKTTSRAKRRNYLAIQSHMRQHAANDIQDEKEKARFKRKLNRHRQRYLIAKAQRPPAWVPTQKMMRFLTSSPSVVKKMLRKAELMGIITQSQHVSHSAGPEKQERKKSHIAPALSAEFVTYYLERNIRIEKMKTDLRELEAQNKKLRDQDTILRTQYDKLLKETNDPDSKLRRDGEKLWSILTDLAEKPLKVPEIWVKRKTTRSPTRKDLPKSRPTVINQCGICRLSHDQHLLARCDKCHLWYHLGCLDPPLTRMPKKTRIMGWQCSQCADTSSEESEGSSSVNVDAPRRLREKIKEPAKLSLAQQELDFLFPDRHGKRSKQKKRQGKKRPRQGPAKTLVEAEVQDSSLDGAGPESPHSDHPVGTPSDVVNISDESSLEVEVKIEEETTPIPKQHPQFQDVSRTGRKIIKKKHYDEDGDEQETSPKQQGSGKKPSPEKENSRRTVPAKPAPKKLFGTHCVTCSEPGTRSNMVSCDNCEQCYHFGCLNPPFKKTPKQPGYTWFCEACDSTDDSDEEEEDVT